MVDDCIDGNSRTRQPVGKLLLFVTQLAEARRLELDEASVAHALDEGRSLLGLARRRRPGRGLCGCGRQPCRPPWKKACKNDEERQEPAIHNNRSYPPFPTP